MASLSSSPNYLDLTSGTSCDPPAPREKAKYNVPDCLKRIASRPIGAKLDVSRRSSIDRNDAFDVYGIDVSTLTRGGAGLATRGKALKLACSYEDVNGDGFTDLMTFFEVQSLELNEGTTQLTLTGYLLDGTLIEGTDSVRIVPHISAGM